MEILSCRFNHFFKSDYFYNLSITLNGKMGKTTTKKGSALSSVLLFMEGAGKIIGHITFVMSRRKMPP